ncbi:MAG: hypothetical protein JST00_15890 [Deltaproteobacteria bacterium]|nr:hypothetical protein [Deltaproteobacteria bacterium]
MSYLSRRALLASATSLALAAISSRARADEGSPPAPAGAAPPASRVVKLASDARGVTATLELAHAPFPAAGSGHQDSTVIAFIPHHHRVARDASVSVVVHFHGHHSTAEKAIVAHQLREQLYESKQNAILLVPQLAVMAADSSAGKLESPGGLARMLADALRVLDSAGVRAATGPAALAPGATLGRLCVSAHSGGFHAAASALRHGGVPVQEVYLFDALYADVDVFKDWVIAGRGKPMGSRHKLVSYFTAGTTEANTASLFAQLEKNGVSCAYEQTEGTLSRADLTRAEAVSIRTKLAHGAVTSELNGLRDCLYASALHRNLRSSWFDAKNGARPLERRR